MKPATKTNIKRVANFTLAYILVGWFLSLYDYNILNSDFSQGPSEYFDALTDFKIKTLVGLLAGILGGSILVRVNSRVFRRKSFGYGLAYTAISYSLIFVLVNVSVSLLGTFLFKGSEGFRVVWDTAMGISLSGQSLVQYILWGFIMLSSLFLLQINDKFGPGMLLKFLSGQYHRPREEERIFMFLDMKGSTNIAERLGNERYFRLLHEAFSDITDAILNTEGEIYQYVGDEVVISWPLKQGVRKANCLRCFYEIQALLKRRSAHYLEHYGLVPEFKAGIHHGQVTAGEIGSIKKDIVYSGDVLNTTARIQSQCNEHQAGLLVSRQTLGLIEDASDFLIRRLGSIALKGRVEEVELNAVELS